MEWLYGLPLQGVYRLSVADFEVGDAGSLTGFSGDVGLLASGNGGSGNNYSVTILADSATRGVIGTTGNNTAPFSGTYRPESPLSRLNRQARAGTVPHRHLRHLHG